MQLIAGLTYPRVTVLFGVLYIVGRAVYGIGYRSQGPAGRSAGAMIFDVAIVVNLVAAIMSAMQLAGGMSGITHFGATFFS